MKKMRKVIALLLVLQMAAAAVGCGSTSAATDAAPAQDAEEPEEPAVESAAQEGGVEAGKTLNDYSLDEIIERAKAEGHIESL